MESKKKSRSKTNTEAKTNKEPAKKSNPDIQKLANRIRQIRKDKGYSNADFFAYEHEITRSQYARYEMGEDLRYTSLLKLIRAFGMTPSEFFEGIK